MNCIKRHFGCALVLLLVFAGPALAGGGESDPAACEALNRRLLADLERDVISEVDQAADEALASRSGGMPAPEEAKTDVYADRCEVLRKT